MATDSTRTVYKYSRISKTSEIWKAVLKRGQATLILQGFRKPSVMVQMHRRMHRDKGPLLDVGGPTELGTLCGGTEMKAYIEQYVLEQEVVCLSGVKEIKV